MKFDLSVLLSILVNAAMVKSTPVWTWEPGNIAGGSVITDTIGATTRSVKVSKGLTGKMIAVRGEPVGNSIKTLHSRNDGGGIIPREGGGYYYASNSEDGNKENGDLTGGVYTFVLDENMDLDASVSPNYYQSLSGTADNCAGGTTSWGTWVSCEEETGLGVCWQVDPECDIDATCNNPSEPTDVTGFDSNWEGFAWNDDELPPRGYVTDDQDPEPAYPYWGALVRFTPSEAGLECYAKETKAERLCTLTSGGTYEYLKLNPNPGESQTKKKGTFEWVECDLDNAPDDCEANPELYVFSEGIHIEDNILTFTAKVNKQIFYLDLDKHKYEEQKTTTCPGAGECEYDLSDFIFQQPDNIRGLGRDMYVCTDGPDPNRIFSIDTINKCYSEIVRDIDHDVEAAGVDFTPDGKYMIMSFQNQAVWVFEREDGLAFSDQTLPRICAKPTKLDYEP